MSSKLADKIKGRKRATKTSTPDPSTPDPNLESVEPEEFELAREPEAILLENVAEALKELIPGDLDPEKAQSTASAIAALVAGHAKVLTTEFKAVKGEVDELTDRVDKLENENARLRAANKQLKDGRNQDTRLINELVDRIDTLEKETNRDAIQAELNSLRKETAETKEVRIRAEIEQRADSMLVRGVRIIQGETNDTLLQQLNGYLEELGVAGAAQVVTARRFPARTDGKVPTVAVRLNNREAKFKIYKALATTDWGRANRAISFVDDYPPVLRDQLKQLEKKAFEVRRDHKWQTRIQLRGTALVLRVRKQPGGRFQDLE